MSTNITILPFDIQHNKFGDIPYCYNVSANVLDLLRGHLDHKIEFFTKMNDRDIFINLCLDPFTISIWRNLYELRKRNSRVKIRIWRCGIEDRFVSAFSEYEMYRLGDVADVAKMIDSADEVRTLYPMDKTEDVSYWNTKKEILSAAMMNKSNILYIISDNFDVFHDSEQEIVSLSNRAFERVSISIEELRFCLF